MRAIWAIIVVVTIWGLTIHPTNCILGGRIVNPPHSRPFMAYYNLEPTDRANILHMVILDEYTLLSMASARRLEKRFPVKAGKYFWDKEEPNTEQIREICAISPHPLLRDDGLSWRYTIVRLAEPFIFNEFVQPVKLAPFRASPPSTGCLLIGWGTTDEKNRSARSSELREKSVTLPQRSACDSNSDDDVHDTIRCVNGGVCSGDYGAPVVCKAGDTYELYFLQLVVQGLCRGGLGASVTEMPRDWFESEKEKLAQDCQGDSDEACFCLF